MKEKIRLLLRTLLIRVHALKKRKEYRYFTKLNHYTDKSLFTEKEWVKKWSFPHMKASPLFYRFFAHYLGENLDIAPEDTIQQIIEPILNPSRYVDYYSDKNMFDKLLPNSFFPRTIIRKIGGLYYDRDYNRLKLDETELQHLLNESFVDRIILKPAVGGMSGRGVVLFEKDGATWVKYQDCVSLSLAFLEGYTYSDFILQECIEQHPEISRFCHTSVNTIRMAVYRSVKDDQCHILGAVMRMGNEGSVVDNSHAGGRHVGLDEQGRMFPYICDQYDRKEFIFNGIDFRDVDFVVPCFHEIRNFALSAAEKIQHHRLIAMDIALKKNGKPILLEFNVFGFSSDLFQCTVGPVFGEYTDEILAYCRQKTSQNVQILHL